MCDSDTNLIAPVVARMSTWLPRLTVTLWKRDEEKDVQQNVNAATHKALQPMKMLEGTEDVAEEMDVEDLANLSESILNVMQKDMKK